ncbi:polyribonucleotide nucleotidyltransferase [Candidatus Lariskella endosymbiont of Epinotia ramella]|uniref:polyribonucleotide nucleotidyltransferase n=1 Tax=Candidatus Lariskella endosymbiont of Epinotia ramella TaxID=3066224 RepID=UPI0030D26C2B
MFNIVTKETIWGNATLKLETGKIARQASGAVIVQMGDTMILATVVAEKTPKEGIDFLPLTVNYQEKFYADGRFPGGFIKREGKNSEREVLTSRLIDRSLRPLFPKNYHNEVQVICTVLSYDPEYNPDILSVIGASAAIAISDIPCKDVIAASRVGYTNGDYFIQFAAAQKNRKELDLVVAGTDEAIFMIESEAAELPQDKMLGAIEFGHSELKVVVDLIKEFAKEIGIKKSEHIEQNYSSILKQVKGLVGKKLAEAYLIPEKQSRRQKIEELKSYVREKCAEQEDFAPLPYMTAFGLLERAIVRKKILDDATRIDGRGHGEIRDISIDIDILPRAHGSSLFTRGETQALAVVTLGTADDEQMTDDLTGNRFENFMLHYNFPAYSVGEVGALRAPGRREIGHGRLAYKSFQSVIPQKEDFAYTIRLVSEVTESNGSSSMATVCASSLAMMAAGIPVKLPVAGIAMGLVKEGEKFAILSDIMGDEDFLGDMDFKVAGTKDGITALQMDIKICGINRDIMEKAISQAVVGINHILSKMSEVLETTRATLSPSAPRILNIMIDKEKIREVIGAGGKVIREICEKSGAKIDVAPDGTLTIFGPNKDSIEIATKIIKDIVTSPEVGGIYDGAVVKITNFGLFVRFLGNSEGMVHISEICNHYIAEVEDVLQEGDKVVVRIVAFEKNGRIKLTMRNLNQIYLAPEVAERLAREPDSGVESGDEEAVVIEKFSQGNQAPSRPSNNKPQPQTRRRRFF